MRDYVRYQMQGFNKQLPKCDNKWAMTLTDARPYLYENHPFLYSVSIDEHITSMTFELKEGLSCLEYIEEIGYELERITFNIISRYPNLPIEKPICHVEAAMHHEKNITEGRFQDGINVIDKCSIAKTGSINELYEAALKTNVETKEKAEKYKELFCILQCSDRVIQFLGLYDIMSDLISKLYKTQHKGTQDKVHDFFGKNKGRYPKVGFYDSNKDNKKKEDSFTYLRNQIAHSIQAGVGDFLEVSEGISFECIQGMLVVINDLLCENVTA